MTGALVCVMAGIGEVKIATGMFAAPPPDPKKAPRPDPQRGVFETLLVAGGRPAELEAHLARLDASLRELYGAELATGAADLVHAEAAGLGLGRLRLTATPRDGGIELKAEAEPLEPTSVFALAGRSVALCSHVLPGGLGPHKWADRTLLEAAQEAARHKAPAANSAPPTPLPLLVDEDGCVLEASRANVFAVRDGVLVTPPADGRILPGITRATVIAIARESGREVREEPLRFAELTDSDEVFLTSSVRGIEPVGSHDGAELPKGDAGALLAAALRRRRLTRPG